MDMVFIYLFMLYSAAQVCASGNRAETIAHTRSVCIYERWSPEEVKQARNERVRAEARKRAFLGGDGHLSCVAESTRRLVSAGGLVYVNSIRFSLWHRVKTKREARIEGELAQQTQSVLDSNSRLVAERIYKGDDWRFEPDEEREVTLSLPVPSNTISLRNTTLLNVSHILQIALQMQFSKDLTVELPIYVTHPASWSDRPPDDNDDDEKDNSKVDKESSRGGERSTNKVYSTYYGIQGIELDSNVELPITSDIASLNSIDGDLDGSGFNSEIQSSESAPQSARPLSMPPSEQGIMRWAAQQDNIGTDDVLAPLPSAPWVTGATGAAVDATGTPASTFGRGLLPRSLHVVNPDQSGRQETEFDQNTVIVRQNGQNDSTSRDRPSLSPLSSNIESKLR
ncbi:hypothetical protein BDF19DRAFT_475433 [Syncephalis fuscata]|nr:hypothetical protein BDF19DRAFT_475433 [Syncephalis fuscata]